ncbi:MAG: adenylosuccinate lyase [Bacteroidales bacterium]|jgi:adenylosuccinate lyase|nr:adenylosuccinate lyase [Bacteroidales bacterium]
MILDRLTAISPVDGRYGEQTEFLQDYFSEYALIKYRVRVEVEYFIYLSDMPLPQLEGVTDEQKAELRKLYESFSLDAARRIKDIEKTTNHDVKAVEYFLREEFDRLNMQKYKEFIHFGLTSQDINNTAIPLAIQTFINNDFRELLFELMDVLEELIVKWERIPMLAHTHGQPASPTLLGKEIMVFYYRLNEQVQWLYEQRIDAKFSGAVGGMNAHYLAYPDIDWLDVTHDFMGRLGLHLSYVTTQVSPYDSHAVVFDNMKRINTILLDFCRDMWLYISMGYFRQVIKEDEVGSSAMPHKINPIDFENAEGNIGVANAIFAHLSAKLPVSRLQRDLTDSTVIRNVGVPFAHTVIAIRSFIKGMRKVVVDEQAIHDDLEKNWVVVAEGIQTLLRREGYPNPYEALKKLTRTNEKIGREDIARFIDSLDVSDELKAKLKAITPFNYFGLIRELDEVSRFDKFY